MSVEPGERQEPHSAPKIARKSHRKSRNGCTECKKRKIKCDEEKPVCSNCVRHESVCSFLSAARSPRASSTNGSRTPSILHGTSPPEAMIASSGDPTIDYGDPPLNISDLELLQNYNTSTSYTLSDIPGIQIFLRVNVIQLALSNPFVLRAILAISALHLAHFRHGEERARYVALAHHHYDIALRTATCLLPTINPSNCETLYMFATFCCYYTMGIGPRHGDFLLFGDQGLAEWMILFRGVRYILQENYETLSAGILSPLFEISIQNLKQPRADDERANELRNNILLHCQDDPDLHVYLEALDRLAMANVEAHVNTTGGSRPKQCSPGIVFVCLYFFSDDFVSFLQLRKQIPLVILAHFCVMLHDLNSFWWIEGWAIHLISEIYSSLNQHYRIWIRWCMEEIGWVPPL